MGFYLGRALFLLGQAELGRCVVRASRGGFRRLGGSGLSVGVRCPGSSSELSVVPLLACLAASKIHPLPEL